MQRTVPQLTVILARVLLVLVSAYALWLIMLALHELGHVLHAWLSGGSVLQVSIPLLGFSQTFVHPNPAEAFVVWGGPVWGSILPLLALGAMKLIRKSPPDVLGVLAGFCLIANGAYLALGWITHAGDAGDLLRLGTPVAALIATGSVAMAAGLWIWHQTPVMRLERLFT